MQTTVRLDDELYRQAKARAADLGVSMARFLEDALRARLEGPEHRPRGSRLQLPVSTARGGLAAGRSTVAEAVAAADLDRDRG
jgi:plasmid stability protein